MPTHDPEILADALHLSLCVCRPACEARTAIDDLPLCQALIRLLARGHPVSRDELVAATGLPPAQLEGVLHGMDIDSDEEGRIIGAGLTLRPTPHRIQLDGTTLYAWCALDTLMYPPLLGRPATVESPCAATGIMVRLTVTPTGLASDEPEGAVVSLVLPEPGQPPQSAFCGRVHFFSSADAAQTWLAQHAGAVIVPVADAYALGRLLVTRRAA